MDCRNHKKATALNSGFEILLDEFYRLLMSTKERSCEPV